MTSWTDRILNGSLEYDAHNYMSDIGNLIHLNYLFTSMPKGRETKDRENQRGDRDRKTANATERKKERDRI